MNQIYNILYFTIPIFLYKFQNLIEKKRYTSRENLKDKIILTLSCKYPNLIIQNKEMKKKFINIKIDKLL